MVSRRNTKKENTFFFTEQEGKNRLNKNKKFKKLFFSKLLDFFKRLSFVSVGKLKKSI